MGRSDHRDIMQRKLKYLGTLASEDGIYVTMDKWIRLLQEIQLEISYELTYRLLEDIFLMLNFGFDWSDLDFPIIPEDIWPDYPPEDSTDPSTEPLKKAIYDKTYYDLSYYDPPEILFKDIQRFMWYTRYNVSEKHTLEYKKQDTSLRTLIKTHKDGLSNAGVATGYLDAIEASLAMVEGKILRGFFVGFAVVGISRVAKKKGSINKIPTRTTEDWKTVIDVESPLAWGAIVGWVRVGYFKVGSYTMVMQKWLSDALIQKINEFWLRSGLVSAGQLSPYGGPAYYAGVYGYPTEEIKTLWPRVFMLQRVDQYHYTGGKHQLKMQFNIKKVKPILDRYGVIAVIRGTYTCFAHELFYKDHEGHRLYKQWKKLLTDEDIIQKYIRMGCEEGILREIQRCVKP